MELGIRRKKEHGQRLVKIMQEVADLDRAHTLSLHQLDLIALMQMGEELKSLFDLDPKTGFQWFLR